MKKGFTLAEVLITLAIIGVVAALTIPSVVRNYQKTQTVTQLKKAYSALVNTTNLAIAQEGPIAQWAVGHWNPEDSKTFANTYLIPYLKVAKNCETKTTNECKFEAISLNNSCSLNDGGSCNLGSNYARFFLNDGTLVAVVTYSQTSPTEQKFATIRIDINGQKKPNVYGKDVFLFRYFITGYGNAYDGKFVPYGHQSSRSNITQEGGPCNKTGDGSYCAALIMKDGWEIKDDYPW